MTYASLANREIILNSIEKINYKGLFTDSPAGIERAIYELKNNGRDGAQKSIIFMTDGIVDTGAPDPDEADTIIREVPSVNESVEELEFKLDEEMDDADSGDETIMLDDGDEEELVSDLDEDVTLRKDE